MDSRYDEVPHPPSGHAQATNAIAGPFFLELQLDATKFCKLIANRLRIEPICLPQKITSPLTGKPALVVDSHRVPGRRQASVDSSAERATAARAGHCVAGALSRRDSETLHTARDDS